MKKINRRSFMKSALAAGAFPLLPGCFSHKGYLANSKVRLACCGIGGMGGEDVRQMFSTGLCDVVALCDVDLGAKHTLRNLNKFPKAARFHDFREMFDRMADQFDAVTAGVPDHAHFPIAMRAMKEGKAIYTEKPMGHCFAEIEAMMKAAEKYGVVTQMGNQGHSCDSYYQLRDYVANGVIDPNRVVKLETHMNYPRRWHKWNGKVGKLPYSVQDLPETMTDKDWDVWCGTCAKVPFSKDLHYGEWRSWFDFGNGCLGDWGAHIFDGIHEFFKLGLPTEIAISDVEGWNRFVFPMKDTVTFKFAATADRKALDLVWREGIGNYPELPKGFKFGDGSKGIPTSGGQKFDQQQQLSAGKEIWMDDGTAWQGGSHNAPLSKCGAGDADIPDWEYRGGGCNWPNQHWENFLRAVRGEIATTSNFGVAGPLSQVFTLGCIAQRLNRTLKFDPVAKQFIGDDEANAFLAPPVRDDWKQYYDV